MAIALPDSVALLTAGNNGGSLEDEFISGLVQGGSWTFGSAPRVLTWSLNINEETGSHPGTPVPGPGGEWGDSPGFAAAVGRGLAAWANVANVQFQRISSGQYYFESTADIAVALAGDDLDKPGQNVAGLAHFPDTDYVEDLLAGNGVDRAIYPGPEGDVFFDNDDAPFEFLNAGGAGFSVVLHELGHALGLKHPFDDGGNERPSFEDLGIGLRDAMRYTVMSYDIANPPYEADGFAATPMPLDILAIQYIYGANMSYRTGDNHYKLSNASFSTIWDAGGEDTFSAASWTAGAQIDLRQGQFSGLLDGPKRMAIAYGAAIENAIGSSSADQLNGNGAGNELSGGAGNDGIFGGGGADVLRGGTGVDRLEGEGGNDRLYYSAADFRLDGGAGIDTLVLARGNLDLRAEANIGIAGIERINTTGGGGNVLTLDAHAVLDMSTTSNTLRIFGDAADTVRIHAEGALVFDQGISGSFHRINVGAAVLLVDTDVSIDYI